MAETRVSQGWAKSLMPPSPVLFKGLRGSIYPFLFLERPSSLSPCSAFPSGSDDLCALVASQFGSPAGQSQLFLGSLSKFPPKHFADGVLGYFFHEDYSSAKLLIGGKPLLDIVFDLFFADLGWFGHDISSRQIRARVFRQIDADNSCFLDPRMRDEQILNLGRRNLQAFVLEQLLRDAPSVCPVSVKCGKEDITYLLPIHDVKFSIPQHSNVTSAKPPIMESVLGSLGIVEIPLCHQRTSHEQLAFLSRFDVVVIVIDHSWSVSRGHSRVCLGRLALPYLDILQDRTDTPGHITLSSWHHGDCSSRLAQTPRLADKGLSGTESGIRRILKFSVHWSSTSRRSVDRLEMILDVGRLRNPEIYRRHSVESRDLVLFHVLKEF